MKKRPKRAAAQNKVQGLLAALNDDLALPLLQIKSGLELVEQAGFNRQTWLSQHKIMSLSVSNGLQLIDAYRLALRFEEIKNIFLEPVAVGAVLQDVAHELSAYAKIYNTEIEVDVQGKLTPVLAHQPSLNAALSVLGSSLIRAQAAQSKQKHYRLLLGAHRTADNVIAAGVFSSVHGLSDKALRSARNLVGKARQPLPSVPPGAASGILIADMLCASMWQPLRAAAHRNLHGLATTIPISKQLQFV